VVLGRSEASLEGYLRGLAGKHLVEAVCMDLAPGYQAYGFRNFQNYRLRVKVMCS
jgi:transposase